MKLGKIFKWSASAARVALAKLRLGRKLQLPHGGKPVYLGRGASLLIADGGVMKLGQGVYIDDRCRLQVSSGAHLSLGDGCYFNTNCRVVASDAVLVGPDTLLGPNVCVFDHDHVFDGEGVHREIVSSPISIGERCWLGANVLVTKGVSISDNICVGGGSAVLRSLDEPGLYVGTPPRLVRRFSLRGSGVDDSADQFEKNQSRDVETQGSKQFMASSDFQSSSKGA